MEDIILDQRINARWDLEPGNACGSIDGDAPQIQPIPEEVLREALQADLGRYYDRKIAGAISTRLSEERELAAVGGTTRDRVTQDPLRAASKGIPRWLCVGVVGVLVGAVVLLLALMLAKHNGLLGNESSDDTSTNDVDSTDDVYHESARARKEAEAGSATNYSKRYVQNERNKHATGTQQMSQPHTHVMQTASRSTRHDVRPVIAPTNPSGSSLNEPPGWVDQPRMLIRGENAYPFLQ